MTKSAPIKYRVWRQVIKQLSWDRSDQHERIRETDWDVLVVLDACRWDTLNRVSTTPIGSARTPGTSTGEWLEAAERSQVLSGTHVVTANSKYENHDLDLDSLHVLTEDAWDDGLGNVPPEPVLDRADQMVAEDEVPAVAHVLPPHGPYISRVDDTWITGLQDEETWNPRVDKGEGRSFSAQAAMAAGRIDMDRALDAYRGSVRSTWEVTAEYVSNWIDDGLTVVVTADHGEAFGRLRDFWLYEHPYGCYVEPVARVPFEVFEVQTHTGTVPESTEEKLRALGYK